MRFLFCFIFLIGSLSPFCLGEATERAVHVRPSADSPIIGHLPRDGFFMAPAGPADLSEEEKKAGWEAISFLDDLHGFVRRIDLTKDLGVVVGAAVYASANEDSSNILTRSEANDLFQVENLDGDWVEVSFRKPVDAFVGPPAEESLPNADVTSPDLAVVEDKKAAAEPLAEGHPAAISDRTAIPTDGILRTFEGRLGKPRSFFGDPLHPYQITDDSGNRIAYLDLSRLLITTPLEHFFGRKFLFYGKAEAIEGRRDFVIRVEQMRQR